jgi:hypothetical protein
MLCMSSDAVGMGSSGKGLIMYVSGDLNGERAYTTAFGGLGDLSTRAGS